MFTRCSRLMNKAIYVQRSVLSHTATKDEIVLNVSTFKAKYAEHMHLPYISLKSLQYN